MSAAAALSVQSEEVIVDHVARKTEEAAAALLATVRELSLTTPTGDHVRDGSHN